MRLWRTSWRAERHVVVQLRHPVIHRDGTLLPCPPVLLAGTARRPVVEGPGRRKDPRVGMPLPWVTGEAVRLGHRGVHRHADRGLVRAVARNRRYGRRHDRTECRASGGGPDTAP